MNENHKWITFGGSYPGSLSALFRAKYPDLIHTSYASSAPMLFTTDFVGYAEVMAKSLDAYNKNCTVEISNAYKKITSYFQTITGRAFVAKLFK